MSFHFHQYRRQILPSCYPSNILHILIHLRNKIHQNHLSHHFSNYPHIYYEDTCLLPWTKAIDEFPILLDDYSSNYQHTSL